MAKTVEQLEAELDILDSAINAGQLTVRYADKSVTYFSMAELLQAAARLQSQIDRLNGTTRRSQIRFITRDGHG